MTVVNLAANPYYDDFDVAKRYYQLLFRPSLGVQSRELTQLQTTIYNQIGKFASHIFKQGSIVTGGQTSIVKQLTAINVTNPAFVDVNNFVGSNVYGDISGNIAKVVSVAPATPTSSAILYCTWINGASFSANELIKQQANPSLYVNYKSAGQTDAIAVGVDKGVFYVNGRFVDTDSQIVTLTDWRNKTIYVGFDIIQTIIDEQIDPSLNDPANGTYNYGAPGATRLKVELSFNQYSTTPDLTKYVDVVRIANGITTKQSKFPIYSELGDTMARRTYDESGNYTTSAFPIYLKNSVVGDPNKLSIGIEPGKAYVYGYEIQTISTEYIDLDRARDTEFIGNFDITAVIGNYALVSSVSGDFNISTMESVSLRNSSNVEIGWAKVRSIRWSQGTIYRLYMFDVTMTSGAFKNVFSIVGSAGSAVIHASGKNSLGESILFDSNFNSLVFPVPQQNVKMLRDQSGAVDTDYTYVKMFQGVAFSNGVSSTISTISTAERFMGNGILSSTEVQLNYIVVVKTVTSGPFTVGQVIDLTVQGAVNRAMSGAETVPSKNRIVFVDPSTGSGQPGLVTFDVKEAAGFTADVFCTINRNKAAERIKTLQQNVVATVTVSTATNTIALPQVDIRSIASIRFAASGTPSDTSPDIQSSFKLDDGQRDNYYDFGKLTYNTGNCPLGTYKITYSYFQHSNDSGYFSVDSYTNVAYENIPTFASQTTGKTLRLSDCIDFRPKRSGVTTLRNDTMIGGQIPVPISTFNASMSYYIGRVDKLVVSDTGEFKVVKGKPSMQPKRPGDIGQAMTLAELYVAPYTASPKDVRISIVDNRRYTMRDIGKLDQRIQNIEYYTALSLLERKAESMTIRDENGLDRFKNGIMTDPFTGHGTGDVWNADYMCAMDYESGIMRPTFRKNSVDLSYNTGTSIVLTGDLYTLPYTQVPIIEQRQASGAISVNPYNVVIWNGDVALVPATDNWIDTVRAPDLIQNMSNRDDVYEAGLAASLSGVRWNDWVTTWQGVASQTTNTWSQHVETPITNGFGITLATNGRTDTYQRVTSTVEDRQQRTGVQTTVTFETVNRSLGERVIDTSVIPWIRSRDVAFTATGLKPNTRVYPFFDEQIVSAWCKPTNGNYNDPLITGPSGKLTGTYTIPNNDGLRFRTGERLFRLVDNAIMDMKAAGTSAQTKYYAQGTVQTKQQVFVSTRQPIISTSTVYDSRVLSSTASSDSMIGSVDDPSNVRFVDPIAQTFAVLPNIYQQGVFLSSIDVFFKRKDPNIPVTLQLRPVVNGYPSSNTVFPFGAVTLESSQVNTSANATVATRFTFPSPVFVRPGEYSFVLLSNSNEYEAFIATIGKVTIDGTSAITDQPYIGSFFMSQNSSTWTADQSTDMMFVINACQFTALTGVGYFRNLAQTAPTYADVLNLSVDSVRPSSTSLAFARLTKARAGNVVDTVWTGVFENNNDFMMSQRVISGVGDITYSATFTSQNQWVSPVLDRERISVLTVENIIGNVATGEEAANGGQALARYISRRMILKDQMDADSFRVQIAMYRPTGSDVRVYAKFLAADDVALFDDRPWTEMPYSGSIKPFSVSEGDWKEATFAIDNVSYVSSTGATFGTFRQVAVKIVLTTANTSNPPMVRELRGIALT